MPHRTGCHRVRGGCGSCPVSHRLALVYSHPCASASLTVGSCLLPPGLTPPQGMEKASSEAGLSEPLGLAGGPHSAVERC